MGVVIQKAWEEVFRCNEWGREGERVGGHHSETAFGSRMRRNDGFAYSAGGGREGGAC